MRNPDNGTMVLPILICTPHQAHKNTIPELTIFNLILEVIFATAVLVSSPFSGVKKKKSWCLHFSAFIAFSTELK